MLVSVNECVRTLSSDPTRTPRLVVYTPFEAYQIYSTLSLTKQRIPSKMYLD